METIVEVEDFLRMEVSTTRIYLNVVCGYRNFCSEFHVSLLLRLSVVRSPKLYYRIDTSWICLSGIA